jgi:hypothetical protein
MGQTRCRPTASTVHSPGRSGCNSKTESQRAAFRAASLTLFATYCSPAAAVKPPFEPLACTTLLPKVTSPPPFSEVTPVPLPMTLEIFNAHGDVGTNGANPETVVG